MDGKRYVLLDRDGTIMADKHYLSDPDEVELLPGAVEGLRRMAALGLGLVQVSNQSGVGRGYFTEEDVARVNGRLAELLRAEGVELDRAFHCPHEPGKGCGCRKPSPGMALQAAEEMGFDPRECFVIGDKVADVLLGREIGAAASILVLTGKGLRERSRCEPDYAAKDLTDAADWIAERLDEKG